MRIAILFDGGNGKFGGSEIYITQLVTALVESGHEVGIAVMYQGEIATQMQERCREHVSDWCVLGNYSLEPHVSFLKNGPFHKITRYFRADSMNLSHIVMYLKQRDLVRWLGKFKPDVGHIHWAGCIPLGLLGSRALTACNIPIVETLHTVPPGRGIYGDSLGRERYRHGRIIAVSEAVKKAFEGQYAVKSPDIEVIYCGVNAEKQLEQANEAMIMNNGDVVTRSDLAHPVILVVGHINRQKGIHVLIEAARLLKERNCRFSVWVLGDGGRREEMENETKRLGVDGQVHFAGFVKNPAPWYAAADICTVCSIENEGLPLNICEAMVFGLAVVATDVGGIREIVHDGDTGLLIKPKSPEMLADALQRLIQDPSLRKDIGRHGLDLVREKFLFQTSVNRYLQIYRELARRTHDKIFTAPPISLQQR